MPSLQRRRSKGQPFQVWPEITVTDARDQVKITVDMDADPYGVDGDLIGNFTPDRGSRAEVPGQQEIDVYRIVFQDELPNVGLFSRVYWKAKYWDVVEPPVYRHGIKRHTRHWTMVIRKRPYTR